MKTKDKPNNNKDPKLKQELIIGINNRIKTKNKEK